MPCSDCNTATYNVRECADCYKRLTMESAKLFTSKEWRERYVKYCLDKSRHSFDEVKND